MRLNGNEEMENEKRKQTHIDERISLRQPPKEFRYPHWVLMSLIAADQRGGEWRLLDSVAGGLHLLFSFLSL